MPQSFSVSNPEATFHLISKTHRHGHTLVWHVQGQSPRHTSDFSFCRRLYLAGAQLLVLGGGGQVAGAGAALQASKASIVCHAHRRTLPCQRAPQSPPVRGDQHGPLERLLRKGGVLLLLLLRAAATLRLLGAAVQGRLLRLGAEHVQGGVLGGQREAVKAPGAHAARLLRLQTALLLLLRHWQRLRLQTCNRFLSDKLSQIIFGHWGILAIRLFDVWRSWAHAL